MNYETMLKITSYLDLPSCSAPFILKRKEGVAPSWLTAEESFAIREPFRSKNQVCSSS